MDEMQGGKWGGSISQTITGFDRQTADSTKTTVMHTLAFKGRL